MWVKFVFIVNPKAGKGDNLMIYHSIIKAFDKKDDDIVLELTSCVGDATRLSTKYCREYGERCILVSCGGDGTLNEIVMGMEGKTPLMVLPMGTGNDFAKKIYGSKKPRVDQVLESFGFSSGRPRYRVTAIDYIHTGHMKSINIMSFGFDTAVTIRGKEIAENHRWLGQAAYKVALGASIIKDGLKFSIRCDLDCVDENGEKYRVVKDMDYTLMAFCNGSYYGGGFCPAPQADISDGILELCYMDQMSIPMDFPIIPRYSAGMAAGHKKVHMMRVVRGILTSTDGTALHGNCDGEPFESDEIKFNVVPGGINLCLPEMER